MRRLSAIAGVVLFLMASVNAIGLQHGLFRSQSTQGAAWQGTATITQERFNITVLPDYLDVELEWVFTTGGTPPDSFKDALEIVGNLNLEAHSVVVAMLTWYKGMILKGKLKTDDVAREEYENVVDRSSNRPPPPRDPVLLEWIRQDNYDISIFPVSFGGERKVRIRYLVPAFTVAGVNKIAYPHAFTQNPTVSIKKGAGVAGYIVEAGTSNKQFDNAVPAVLDAKQYSFQPYGFNGSQSISYIVPVLSGTTDGSTLYIGAFSTPTFGGEAVHVTTMDADKAIAMSKFAEDFVILWRWTHPQIMAKYARQIVEQSTLLTTFLETLQAADKRAALIIDKEGGDRIVFRLDRRGGREFNRMVAYLADLGKLAVIDPPLRQTPVTLNIPYDADKAFVEFQEALQAAMALFRRNSATVKHLLILTAGPQLVYPAACKLDSSWDTAVDVNLLTAHLQNTTLGANNSPPTDNLYWPGVDLSSFVHRYNWGLTVAAAIGNASQTNTIQVLEPPQDNCSYCQWRQTTEMHVYTAAPLRREITWSIKKGDKVLGQYVESPRIVAMDDGMQYARLICASCYLVPLAGQMPSSIASTLGFIDTAYSLVALEQDALPVALALQYDSQGVPLLDPKDLFPAANERTNMPVAQWLTIHPPQSMAQNVYMPSAGNQCSRIMFYAVEDMAVPLELKAGIVAVPNPAGPTLATPARLAMPEVTPIYYQTASSSGYPDYSDALAVLPGNHQAPEAEAVKVVIRNGSFVIDLKGLEIDKDGQVGVLLYDFLGRVVGAWNAAVSASHARLSISSQSLPSGAYVMRIHAKNIDYTRRVLIR